MSGREITADRRAWLVGELEAWTSLGLLSGDQAGRLLALYEGGEPEREAARRSDRASAAVMGLGALLIGLAVLTAVAFNWSELPNAARIVLIFLTLGGTYGGAWMLRYRGAARTTSDVVFFLGCLFYGAAIALVSQMFHFSVEWADGFWWWGVGVLPFALVLGTWPLHALVAATMAYYLGTSAFALLFASRWMREFAEPAWSVPLVVGLGLAWAYRHGSRSVTALYVALGTWWLLLQPTVLNLDAAPIYWAGLVGSILLLLAECHRPETGLGIPYRFFGVVLVGGVLLPLSTYAANSAMSGEILPTPLAIETAAAVVLAAILLVVAADRDRRRSGRPTSLGRSVLDAPGRWFPLAMLALFVVLGFWNAVVAEPITSTVAANVAMASLAIWLTIVGAREDRGRPFAAGVAYFLLWSIARYIDLFSGFGGMPGAALMFLACGAALVGASLLWRRLKEVRHAPA